MPQVTDPALLQALNGGGKPAPVQQSPTIYRTPSKPLPNQRPAEVQGDALANTKAEIDIKKGLYQLEQEKIKAETEAAKYEATGGIEGQQSESKAAALTTNLQASLNEISAIAKNNPAAQQPGFWESVAGIAGPDAEDLASSSQRRDVKGAQFVAVDSALTLATGAAYTAEQLEGYTRNLFPNYFDDAANIASKKRRFETIIRSGRVQAGAAAPNIDKALAAVEAIYGPYEKAAAGGDKPAGGALSADVPSLPESGAPGTPIIANGVTVGYFDQDGKPVQIDTGPNFDANGNPIPVDQLNAKADSLIGDFGAGVGDIAQGVGDMAGIVANPVNMAINAATGSQLSTDLGQSLRNATGLPESRNPVASAINRGGAAALTGAGVATGLARGAGMGGNAVVNALSQQPIQQGIAGASAGASSELTRKAGGGPIAQGVAGLAGGVSGFSAANRVIRAAQPKQANALAQAAQRQSIDLLPAQSGGSIVRGTTAGARQGIISELPIAKAIEKQSGQIEAARVRVIDSVGTALPKEQAGDVIRQAANVLVKRTGEVGGNLYTRAFKRSAGHEAALPGAVKAADEELAKIAASPGGKDTGLYKELSKLRTDMASGKFSVEGIHSMKSTLRDEASFKGLRGGNVERIYGRIAKSASEDMIGSLQKAGKQDAAQALKTADDFWRVRVETIDEVLDPLLGKNSQRSGAQIVKALENMAKEETGNSHSLRRVLEAMPKKEASNTRATIIDRMGKTSAGRETGEGDAFSLDTFLTHYNGMSPQARSMIFQGESRQALDDLARIAGADKKAGRFLNTSNTARAVTVQGGVAGLAGYFISPMAAVSIGGTQFALGKLLASPKFANWLARAPKNPAAFPQYTKKLSAIASAEPIIANDIANVQRFLSDQFAKSPGRLAAEDTNDTRREPPAQ